MPFYNKKPAPTPAPANSGASAKTLGFFTGIISFMVGVNTLVVSCSNDRAAKLQAASTYVAAEEKFWTDRYTEQAAVLAMEKGNPDRLQRLKLLYVLGMTHAFDPARAGDDQARIFETRFNALKNHFAKLFEQKENFTENENNEISLLSFDIGQTLAQAEVGESGNSPVRASDQQITIISSEDIGSAPRNNLLQLTLGNQNGYDFDIFWCDASDNAMAQQNYDDALTAGNALATMANENQRIYGQSIGRVRVRVLPIARQGGQYPSPFDPRTSGLSIRPDASIDAEKEIANALLELPTWKDGGYRRVDSTTNSQWYISMFVCHAPATSSNAAATNRSTPPAAR